MKPKLVRKKMGRRKLIALDALDAFSERLSRNNTHVVVSHVRQIATVLCENPPACCVGIVVVAVRTAHPTAEPHTCGKGCRLMVGGFCKNHHLVFWVYNWIINGELNNYWAKLGIVLGICLTYVHLPLWILHQLSTLLCCDSDPQVCLSIASNGSTKLFPTLSYELHATSMNPEVSKVLSVARWNLKPTYFTHIAKTCTYIIYLMYLHLYTGPNMWVMVPNHLANLKTLKVIAKDNLVSWHGSLAETRKKMPSNVLVVDWRINQPVINFLRFWYITWLQ